MSACGTWNAPANDYCLELRRFKDFLKLLRVMREYFYWRYALAIRYPRATRNLDIWIASIPENAPHCVYPQEFGFDSRPSTELYSTNTSYGWAKLLRLNSELGLWRRFRRVLS